MSKQSAFEALPSSAAVTLAAVSLILVLAISFYLYTDLKTRARVVLGLLLGTGWIIPVAALKGSSAQHVLLLYSDAMLALCSLMLFLREDIRDYMESKARGETNIEPPSEARARVAVFATVGIGALLLLVEYLPVW